MVLAALLKINSLYFWILNSLLMIYMYIFDFVDHFRMQILLDFDSLSCWVSLFLLSQSLPLLLNAVSRTLVVLKKTFPCSCAHVYALALFSISGHMYLEFFKWLSMLSFPSLLFFLVVVPCQWACGILVPCQRLNPDFQQWKCRVVTTGSPGNSLPPS